MANREVETFLKEHIRVTRRFWLRSTAFASASYLSSNLSAETIRNDDRLKEAIADLETWLTHPDDFRDVSRGKPKPHSLSEDQRIAVGLTRETWKLTVSSDPEHPAVIKNPLKDETAFTFDDLIELSKTRAVRFAKVMTCLNIGCPLGNGIWEGVPMRDIIWKTQPVKDLRRVFYYGFHNKEPKQMFRSSLPIGRVLEDYHGLPPVILCYKLNGQWLSPERGAPVRVVVPEAYGFKSIKWLSHLVLSNRPAANDTYAEKNNDVDSPMKTFCAVLSSPKKVNANEPIPITGWAQAGVAGLKQVQIWIARRDKELDRTDPYFSKAPWKNAEILPFSENVGGGLTNQAALSGTMGFDSMAKPVLWPMALTRAHWCGLHKGLPPGEYVLRCRTIDGNGFAQPMPRPFRKSGHADIQQIGLNVV